MKFRTEYEAKRLEGTSLKLDSPAVLLGSCFADYIGARMRDTLWNAQNPLGVLFNPLSIAGMLQLCLAAEDFDGRIRESVFTGSGIFHSWLADSSFSSNTPDQTVARISAAGETLTQLLGKGNTLIVTFGTSYCYFLKGQPGYVVANCHKQPETMFERRRIGTVEIVEAWKRILSLLKSLYHDIRVIFTVSPVRHVRDGLHENQLSKATMLMAVETLCREHDFCSYFPAYEILMDDLRDYRFYADDLVHPSPMAVEYIWQKFIETYIDPRDAATLREGEKICRRLHHRPLVTGAESGVFSQETERLLDKFMQQHPNALKP